MDTQEQDKKEISSENLREELPHPPSLAKAAPYDFYRHMPHFEGKTGALFVTFTTYHRWLLPPEARKLTLKHILHDHGSKMQLICAVVMPDHVHFMYSPLEDSAGKRYTKTEIVGAIKSVSAHTINKALNRKGAVWQDESFDHVLRQHESAFSKALYICDNPVRKGLCEHMDEYPFLWRSWVDDIA